LTGYAERGAVILRMLGRSYKTITYHLDGGEADDKIIAELKNDYVFSDANDISDLPDVMIERLHHSFATYKIQPGKTLSVEIGDAYGKEHAHKVIKASMED
jgi:inorganic pyrophosphatase